MDLFSRFPFYGLQGGCDDPRCGCYGARSHPSMRPSFYDYPFYSDLGGSHFPFHRPSKQPSPFERRRCSPFDNVVDQTRRASRAHVTPQSPSKPAKDSSVVRGRDEDAAEKTTDAMTSSADDTNSTPQSSAEQKTDPTSEVMPSQHAEQPAEELAATNVEPIEFKKIEEIMTKSKELEEQIASYNGIPGSKDYIYIEESLVAILLQLDKVETNGNMEIRKRRKSAVCSIQQMLTDLETKAKNNMTTTETDSDTTEAMATDEAADLSTAEQPSTATSGEDSISNDDPSSTTDSYATEAMATDEVTDVSTAEQPSTATSGEDSLSNVDPSNTTDSDTTEAMTTDEAADLSTAEQPSTATSGEDSILNVDPSNTTDEEAAAVSDEEITGDVCVEELSSEHSTVQSDGSPDSTLYDNNSR